MLPSAEEMERERRDGEFDREFASLTLGSLTEYTAGGHPIKEAIALLGNKRTLALIALAEAEIRLYRLRRSPGTPKLDLHLAGEAVFEKRRLAIAADAEAYPSTVFLP